MRRALLGTVASIGLIAATPSYAWERCSWVLLEGQVWNGNAAMNNAYGFDDRAACETAATEFETNGKQAIASARPGLTQQGVRAAFWHICKSGCTHK